MYGWQSLDTSEVIHRDTTGKNSELRVGTSTMEEGLYLLGLGNFFSALGNEPSSTTVLYY